MEGLYGEETYSVSQLSGEIREILVATFPELWVVGEIQRLKSSRAGHLYFELIEKGDDDEIVGKLDVAVWRTYNRRVQASLNRAGAQLAEGQQIRCLGRVDFYEKAGRLQLIVTDIDPTFTLGRLELRRRETVAALEKAGLLGRNAELALVDVPLHLALITSEESAAYHDFLSSLAESPYGFRVTFIHASVQGPAAESDLASALRIASSLDVDCIALIRGGGSRSDLAVFDSRVVAEAVAAARHPVLTGLGHETDQSVTDMTAHTQLKTPTKVAEFLVARVADAESELRRVGVGLRHLSLGHLQRARIALGRAETALGQTGLRVGAARERWRHLRRGLGRAAGVALSTRRRQVDLTVARLASTVPRYLQRSARAPQAIASRMGPAAGRRMAAATKRLEVYERLCSGLSPARALARGFSITRTVEGRVIRSVTEVAVGSTIRTELAGGELSSRVEES